MKGARLSRKAVLIALLVAAAIPYFVNLGVSSIWDANEAFYAQTPREMLAANDLVNPSFNFQLRYNKPVLSYWEVAAAYSMFGVSERSERLPIALGRLAPRAAAGAPHHHRRAHRHVHRPRAVVFRAVGSAPGEAPRVPRVDVRG